MNLKWTDNNFVRSLTFLFGLIGSISIIIWVTENLRPKFSVCEMESVASNSQADSSVYARLIDDPRVFVGFEPLPVEDTNTTSPPATGGGQKYILKTEDCEENSLLIQGDYTCLRDKTTYLYEFDICPDGTVDCYAGGEITNELIEISKFAEVQLAEVYFPKSFYLGSSAPYDSLLTPTRDRSSSPSLASIGGESSGIQDASGNVYPRSVALMIPKDDEIEKVKKVYSDPFGIKAKLETSGEDVGTSAGIKEDGEYVVPGIYSKAVYGDYKWLAQSDKKLALNPTSALRTWAQYYGVVGIPNYSPDDYGIDGDICSNEKDVIERLTLESNSDNLVKLCVTKFAKWSGFMEVKFKVEEFFACFWDNISSGRFSFTCPKQLLVGIRIASPLDEITLQSAVLEAGQRAPGEGESLLFEDDGTLKRKYISVPCSVVINGDVDKKYDTQCFYDVTPWLVRYYNYQRVSMPGDDTLPSEGAYINLLRAVARGEENSY